MGNENLVHLSLKGDVASQQITLEFDCQGSSAAVHMDVRGALDLSALLVKVASEVKNAQAFHAEHTGPYLVH